MSPVQTPLLDRVRYPADLRNFSPEQLRQLADELRAETIDAVSVTGGHLGASLGVVELTVAIHAIFDTPRDRLLWGGGHQANPNKILTGRRDRIRTLGGGGGAVLDVDFRRSGHGGGAGPEGCAVCRGQRAGTPGEGSAAR